MGNKEGKTSIKSKWMGTVRGKLQEYDHWRWTGLAVFALGFLAVFALITQITLYCDDYLYGTFLKHGWSYFWGKTVRHYNKTNGRAFIHFMCQVTLLFDAKLYMVLCPVMLALIFILGQRLQGKGVPLWLNLLTSGVAMLAVVALPLGYTRTCVMWISSAFNYIFPPCVMLLAMWLYIRDFKSRRAWIGVLVMCFLAGATTEQTGFAACICIGGWGLLGFLRGKLPIKKFLLPVMAAGIGYLTILIAPGTRVRMYANGGGGGLFTIFQPGALKSRLLLSMQYFTGESGIPWLFLTFALLFALHLALTRRKVLWALPGLGMLGGYLLLLALQRTFSMEMFSILAFAGAAVIYLWRPETTFRGLLLCGMLGAQLIMVLNTSAAPRTTVPAILLLLAVCASMSTECFEALAAIWPKHAQKFCWAAPALIAAVMVALMPGYLPTLRGYRANTPVTRANEKELLDRSDDVVRLDMDMNGSYQYTNYFASDYFLKSAMDYYGITNERIDYTSDTMDVYNLYGTRAGLPVFKKEGELYLSVVSAADACGGKAEWVQEFSGIKVLLGEKGCLFRNNGEVYAWDEENQCTLEKLAELDIWVPYKTYYVPAGSFCSLMDMEMDYNEEQCTYYLSQRGE